MTYFLAGIFGGLGLGTVLGFLVGAWSQRRLKTEVAIVEARERIAKAALESGRYETVEDESLVGAGHPGGVVPPTHDQARRESKKAGISTLMKRFGFP